MANGLLILHQSRLAKKTYPTPNAWANKLMRPNVRKPGPNATSNLSGIWDDLLNVGSYLKGKATDYAAGQLKNQLTDAEAKLKSKIGTFLTTQQTLINLRSRAQAQTGSKTADVSSRASAIVAKSNALLNQYTNIESNAMNLASTMTALKDQITNDPLFKNLDPTNMGSRISQLYNAYVDKVAKAATSSIATIKAMDNHISNVSSLSSDVDSLENLAQGKGFQSFASSFGGSLATNALKPAVMIGTAALAVYFLAPSFFGRLARK